ncbi:MAG: hypothetical protein ACRC20_08490 [Segniliparus sp.]|uniref:hypothetical protein n=1 Tax=Segniliparus sp. TaxID=2804064 RepID=UPI003F2DFCFF
MGAGVCTAAQASADPGAQDLLLTAEDSPEGYTPHPQSLEDALSTLTTARDWMFGGGAQIDPPTCTAELTWFMTNLIPDDSAAITIWGPQMLLADGVGRGGHQLKDFDSHIDTCKKVRVTSGAVIVDATLEKQEPPKTAATASRGFKETVTFTLGGFQQTRVVVGFYGSVGSTAALVIGGSRDLDPSALASDTILSVVSDFYLRQIAKVDKARPHK